MILFYRNNYAVPTVLTDRSHVNVMSSNYNDVAKEQTTFYIESFVINPNYNPIFGTYDDISVLYLKKPVDSIPEISFAIIGTDADKKVNSNVRVIGYNGMDIKAVKGGKLKVSYIIFIIPSRLRNSTVIH